MTSGPIERQLCQGRSRETCIDLEDELWRVVLLYTSYAKEGIDLEDELWWAVQLSTSYAKKEAEKHAEILKMISHLKGISLLLYIFLHC